MIKTTGNNSSIQIEGLNVEVKMLNYYLKTQSIKSTEINHLHL